MQMSKNQYILSPILVMISIITFTQDASAQKKDAKHSDKSALDYSYQSIERWTGSRFSEAVTFFDRSYLSFDMGITKMWGISDMVEGASIGILSNISFGHWIAPIHGLEVNFSIGAIPYASWTLDSQQKGAYSPDLTKYWAVGLTYMVHLSSYASKSERSKRWELIGLAGVDLRQYEKYSLEANVGMRLQYNVDPRIGIYLEPTISLFNNKLDKQSSQKFTAQVTPSISLGFSVHFNNIQKNNKEHKENNIIPDKPKQIYQSLKIKTNMLYWTVFAPNIGIEYRFRNHWSVGVSASAAWWQYESTHQYYQVGIYQVEGRRYLGKKKRQHLGVYLQGGMYDLEFTTKGKIGEFLGIGVSYGYILPVSDHFSLDFEIGFGYTNTSYEVYEYAEPTSVYEYLRTSRSHLLAPSKIGITLVWSIDLFKNKGVLR